MKNIIILISLATFLMLSFHCSRKEMANPIDDPSNDPTSILRFHDISSGYYSYEGEKAGVFPIIKIKLWRRSCPDGPCLCKIGACEVWFFGWQIWKSYKGSKDLLAESGHSREIFVRLPTNQSGISELNLYLANDASGFNEEELKLLIDQDIYDSFEGDTIILLEGEYPFDPNMGNFGGYKISYELIIKH